jgi:type II secretory pathway component PulK
VRTGFLRNDGDPKKRKGLVLLSVLLVSLFLLTASTGFALFARRSVRAFDGRQRAFTARMVCEASLPAAKALLELHPGKGHAPGDEVFSPRILGFPEAGVTVEMTITPLNGRFPLNGIFLPDGRTVRSELAGPWRRLWRRAGAENIEAAVLDFLDGDGEPRLGGGERDGYLNRPLLSLNELLFVPGMTADILYGTETRPGIASLVTLRSDGKINANTALPEVLALLDGLDGNIAADLVRARETRVFTSMEDLSAVPSFPASARAQLMNVLSFTSSHFRVSFTVGFADGQKTPLEVILERKGSAAETVRWEEP